MTIVGFVRKWLVLGALLWGSPAAVAADEADTCAAVGSSVARNYPTTEMEKLSLDSGAVIVGDSIAAYWPRDSLQSALMDKAVNLGFPQDEPGNVLWRLGQIAGQRHWTRALVIVGVNSAWKSPGCDVAAGIEAVVSRLHAIAPGVQVAVLAVLPFQPGLTRSLARIDPINAQLRADATGKRFVFVDPGREFILACGGKPRCLLLRDWLHPTDAGYAVIGRMVLRAFSDMAPASHGTAPAVMPSGSPSASPMPAHKPVG